MSTHTPGPWIVGYLSQGPCVSIIAESGKWRCTEIARVFGATPDEAILVAALIAAAPETAAERDRLRGVNSQMLEALEQILLRACYGLEEDVDSAPEMLRAVFDDARAAIAAAKGQAT
jgi:hypothetical protein